MNGNNLNNKRLCTTLVCLTVIALCMVGCCKDEVWREHYTKTYKAGDHITVSTDSIATVASAQSRAAGDVDIEPMPGYLTVFSSHYLENDEGNRIYKKRSGLEAMHNILAKVKVTSGDPADIRSLWCTITGLASRYDIAHEKLLGPSASASNLVEMSGLEGSVRFRILGSATTEQLLRLHLLTTYGKEFEVAVDATKIMSRLHPSPFELSVEGDISTDIDSGMSAEIRMELEANVNVDIEVHLPDPETAAGFTAAIVNWTEKEEYIDVY